MVLTILIFYITQLVAFSSPTIRIDCLAKHAELSVTLDKETCPWLEQHVVRWFSETVTQAVLVEFNRYLGAGDPELARKRLQQLEKSIEQSGGFVGMHL